MKKLKEHKWINAQDELPKICEDILFTDGKDIWKGWVELYDKLEGHVFYADHSSRDKSNWPDNVTHWMPLPELPKQ